MTLRIYYQFLAFNMSIRLKEGQERKSKEYKKAKGKEKQNQIYKSNNPEVGTLGHILVSAEGFQDTLPGSPRICEHEPGKG